MDETYLSSNHMAYSHQIVVYDISEVVCRKSVVFQDDLVIDDAVIEYHLPMHYVFEHCLAFRHFHADDE